VFILTSQAVILAIGYILRIITTINKCCRGGSEEDQNLSFCFVYAGVWLLYSLLKLPREIICNSPTSLQHVVDGLVYFGYGLDVQLQFLCMDSFSLFHKFQRHTAPGLFILSITLISVNISILGVSAIICTCGLIFISTCLWLSSMLAPQ
jgi:hypothetical protein